MTKQGFRVGAEQRLAELEDDPGAAKLAERIPRPAVRADERAIRELLCGAVMVADDDLEAKGLRFRDLGDRRDPAVDREDKAAAVLCKPRERLAPDAVALVEAARQVPFDLGAELPPDQDGEGGRTDPVRVVVTVDADSPSARDRSADRRAGRCHIAETLRVMRRERTLEERARPRDVLVPAANEHGRRRRTERELMRKGRDHVASARFD